MYQFIPYGRNDTHAVIIEPLGLPRGLSVKIRQRIIEFLIRFLGLLTMETPPKKIRQEPIGSAPSHNTSSRPTLKVVGRLLDFRKFGRTFHEVLMIQPELALTVGHDTRERQGDLLGRQRNCYCRSDDLRLPCVLGVALGGFIPELCQELRNLLVTRFPGNGNFFCRRCLGFRRRSGSLFLRCCSGFLLGCGEAASSRLNLRFHRLLLGGTNNVLQYRLRFVRSSCHFRFLLSFVFLGEDQAQCPALLEMAICLRRFYLNHIYANTLVTLGNIM